MERWRILRAKEVLELRENKRGVYEPVSRLGRIERIMKIAAVCAGMPILAAGFFVVWGFWYYG